MPKKTDTSPEAIRNTLQKLIINFEEELKSAELREKVLAMIPVFKVLRKLGKSLIPQELTSSARDRILFYFQKYPYTIIHGDEFLVISGIQKYARRFRELRVQFGWSIASGKTVKEMAEQGDFPLKVDMSKVKPDSYVLLSEQQDKEAAFRWAVANEIRKKKEGVRSKLLEYFKENVNKSVRNCDKIT